MVGSGDRSNLSKKKKKKGGGQGGKTQTNIQDFELSITYMNLDSADAFKHIQKGLVFVW